MRCRHCAIWAAARKSRAAQLPSTCAQTRRLGRAAHQADAGVLPSSKGGLPAGPRRGKACSTRCVPHAWPRQAAGMPAGRRCSSAPCGRVPAAQGSRGPPGRQRIAAGHTERGAPGLWRTWPGGRCSEGGCSRPLEAVRCGGHSCPQGCWEACRRAPWVGAAGLPLVAACRYRRLQSSLTGLQRASSPAELSCLPLGGMAARLQAPQVCAAPLQPHVPRALHDRTGCPSAAGQ